MEVDKYEKVWMSVTAVFLAFAAGTLIWSVVAHRASLPEPAGRIDPELVRETAPFDTPGLIQTGDNTYDLVYIAQAWQWTPQTVTVPKDAEITIKATTVDVLHGMKITDTNVNVMMIPGQISEVTDLVFDEAGTYQLVCHEYCGIQHHLMGAEIIVE